MRFRPAPRGMAPAAVLAVPVVVVALVGMAKEAVLSLSGPRYWEGARAGEERAVQLPEFRYILDTVAMLRDAGIADYALSGSIATDHTLYQRTIELAWPIRPRAGSRVLLSLASEALPGCTLLDRTERTILCERR